MTGLFYSLNQHYIAPASRPRSRAEEPVEPVEPVPPERGPVPQGRRSRPEQAGAAGAGRSRPRSRAAEKKKKDLTNDLIACISGDVARGSALIAKRRPIYAIKFGFSLTT